MATARLQVEIDASGAKRGADEVTRSLDQIQRAAANSNRATDQVNQGMDRTGRGARRAATDVDRLKGAFDRARQAAAGFGAVLGALGVAFAARAYVQATDSLKLYESQLRLVTDSAEELEQVQGRLFELAQSTRSELGSTVQLYARLARSSDQLGASQDQLLTVAQAVNQAIQISGATSAEASAGVIQFAQGLASGALRGDELRSVLEQLPRLAQAIAEGMGVTIGQLRELGQEGELSATAVINALLNQADTLQGEFSRVERTVGQALTQLQNDLLATVGEIDDTTAASDELIEAIDALRTAVSGDAFQGALTILVEGFALLADNIGNATENFSRFTNALNDFDLDSAGANFLRFLYEGSVPELGARFLGIESLTAEGLFGNRDAGTVTGTGNSPLETGLGTPALLGGGASEADEDALKKLRTEFERLRTEIDPLGEATRQYQADLQLLNEAVAAGLLPAEELADAQERLYQARREALNPIIAMVEQLEQERALLALTGAEREIATDLLDLENRLKDQGVEVTEELTQALREQLQATQAVRAQNRVDEIARENDELRRLIGSVEQGEAAYRAMQTQLEIENALRREGLDIKSREGQALAREIQLRSDLEAQLDAAVERRQRFDEALGQGLDMIGQAFEDIVFNGADAIDTLDNLGRALQDLLFQLLVLEPLKNTLRDIFNVGGSSTGGGGLYGGITGGGGGGNFLDAIFGSIFGSSSSSAAITPFNGTVGSSAFSVGSLSGYASGGSFMVGPDTSLGSISGVDNRLIAFRARDGEEVTVRTPAQRAANANAPARGGDQIQVNVNVHGVTDAASFQRSKDQIARAAFEAGQRARRRNG